MIFHPSIKCERYIYIHIYIYHIYIYHVLNLDSLTGHNASPSRCSHLPVRFQSHVPNDWKVQLGMCGWYVFQQNFLTGGREQSSKSPVTQRLTELNCKHLLILLDFQFRPRKVGFQLRHLKEYFCAVAIQRGHSKLVFRQSLRHRSQAAQGLWHPSCLA